MLLKNIIYFLYSQKGTEDVSVEGKNEKNTLIRTFNLRCLFQRTRRDFNFAIENNYPSRLYTHVNALFYILILSLVYICFSPLRFWYEAINKMKAVQWLNFKTSSQYEYEFFCFLLLFVIIHKELSTRFSTFICWKMLGLQEQQLKRNWKKYSKCVMR